MVFGLYPNCDRKESLQACASVMQILRDEQVKYWITDRASGIFNAQECAAPAEMAKTCDVVIVFGGDGTMLDAVGHFAPANVSLFGINSGKIGFLTELDHAAQEAQLRDAIGRILHGSYTIEQRTMLQAECNGKKYYALNEFLLSSTDNCHIVTVRVEIDGTLADRIRCDGVMVATPTGSTAYSLSCGGPVLSPSVRSLILNTVCPHSLHSVPVVISDESRVVLSVANGGTQLTYDGKIAERFRDPVRVEIQKNAFDARFVRIEKDNFYQRLLQKLSYWGE